MPETDYKKAYERQKLAREKAETLLEDRSRELFEANTSLRDALERLQNQQEGLIQREKLAALGMLAAGIAHEINNPIGFISSNLQTLDKYFEKIGQGLQAYEALKKQAMEKPNPDPQFQALIAGIDTLAAETDLHYFSEDGREIIQESLDGANRVARIVRQLRNYARTDDDAMGFQDLNKIIDNMLNLARNNLKYKCDIRKDLGKIPPLYGSGTQLGQVLLNIVINASQAISENGVITIATRHEGDNAVITIADNGGGIAQENLQRIFDPFFTTKGVGEGTGLGLSIVQGIIKKHRGEIEVDSEPGEGTTFRITLPLFPEEGD